MLMTLTLAAALALSPPAHAITDGQADAIIYAEAVAALESLVAQSTKSAAAGERALKVAASIEASVKSYRAQLGVLVAGTSTHTILSQTIAQMEARAAAIRRGVELAKAAGWEYAAAMSMTTLSVPLMLVPSEAVMNQIMYGPEYVPTYDSAMYDPTGIYGEFSYGGELWLERMLDGMFRGSKARDKDKIVWASWSDEDPPEDNPGPVALGGDDLPSITAESEGPLGPLMLTLAQDYRMQATVTHLGALSEQYATPLWFPVEVDGVVVVTVIYGADYAESYAGDSRADWHMGYTF